jgi:hypothetical protein
MKKASITSSQQSGRPPLRVWAERRTEPDWDRFIAALVALAMQHVDADEAKEARE